VQCLLWEGDRVAPLTLAALTLVIDVDRFVVNRHARWQLIRVGEWWGLELVEYRK
jgi:hypothetical protein